ncbi:hypothetical protein UFOVP760_170 [uncultured Caudovirales phage]|uniref:Uncharacterized protein n=1 Tax=uncultured Caudovirales phage TaxID=2100421 RepID=A0A6J7X9S8_9CAUD|nr:hypothetical protein UFOVP760_170 [uncultured Caudovirales phage]
MDVALDLTDFDQHIYNTHLRISRSQRSQPFKFRKDFSNIDPVIIKQLKKISIFLTKHNHIALDNFIKAPYVIYPDESYFDIEYYTTLKATKAYTLYQRKKLFLDPDAPEQLTNIVESLKYISNYCHDNNIEIDDYITHRSNNTPSFILHLKEHRVNVYCLLGFTQFDKQLKLVDNDILEFILGNEFLNNIPTFRLKFFASKTAKLLIKAGIQKLKNKLKNKLEKQTN